MKLKNLIVFTSDKVFEREILAKFKNYFKSILVLSPSSYAENEGRILKHFLEYPKDSSLGIVFKFGKILPADLVNSGLILNIHYSLLPKYRGANPLIAQLLAGEKYTGVTVHRVTEQVDSGKILFQFRLKIPDDIYKEELEAMLDSFTFSTVLDKLLEKIRNKAVFSEQNYTSQTGEASYAPLYLSSKEYAYCDLKTLTLDEVYRRVRAFSYDPAAWTRIKLDNKIYRLNIYRIKPLPSFLLKPGHLAFVKQNLKGLVMGTLLGSFLLVEGAIESKRRLKQEQWLSLKGRIKVL